MFTTEDLYLRTLIPEIPRILNTNFSSVKRYLDVFYDENNKIIVAPINTTGNIKGATIQGTTGVFDNLIVRTQFTNILSNVNTADLDFVTTYNGIDASTRVGDASLGEDTNRRYLEIVKPYYKLSNDVSYGFRTTNISQEFQIIFDVSGNSDFNFLLDPCTHMTVTPSDASKAWLVLICNDFDASLGSSWIVKQYAGNYTIN